jgi:hypothetical protein
MKINKTYQCSTFFLCQKLKSTVSFIHVTTILYIFLHGFILSSSPQRSLKSPLALIPLALNPMCLLKYVLN